MEQITNSNKYCNIQDGCKLLQQANNQYDKVVQQNQSLQQELRNARRCCENCKGKEDYSNMERHCINATNSVHKYQQALKKIEDLAEHWAGCASDEGYNIISEKINEVFNAN